MARERWAERIAAGQPPRSAPPAPTTISLKEPAMSLEALRNALPEYAKDQKLNLGSLAAEPALTPQQRAGTFVASALASRNATVIKEIVGEFGPQLSPEALNAAKTAAS